MAHQSSKDTSKEEQMWSKVQTQNDPEKWRLGEGGIEYDGLVTPMGTRQFRFWFVFEKGISLTTLSTHISELNPISDIYRPWRS